METNPEPSLMATPAGIVSAEPMINLSPDWVPLVYAGLGAAWIVGSDIVLGLLFEARYWDHVYAQNAKGVLFVSVTALTLYLIMTHYAKRLSAKAAALVKVESSFREFADSATDWLWEMGPDLRVVAVSGRFHEITGDHPGTLAGKSMAEFVAEADSGLMGRHLQNLKARRPFRDFVYTYRNSAGRAFHFRISGKPFFDRDGELHGYRGVGSDVTREVELRASGARLAEIIEDMPDFVGILSAEGKVRFINRGGREMMGIGMEMDAATLSIDDLHPVEVTMGLRDEGIPTALATGRWSGKTALKRISGEPVSVAQTILAHRGPKGEIGYLSTVMRDLTDQTRLEEELRQAQRMDALGQLTGGVAHDFNNVLVVVMGSAETLMEHLANDPPGRELAEAIMQSAERCADLTHRLLAFSRQQALRPQRVDLGALVGSMEHLLHRTLGDDIRIESRYREDLWSVFADKGEIETCLLNLAVNARDAMPNGGSLKIEMSNKRLAAGDELSAFGLLPGDYVELSVSDTGAGIDKEVMSSIFNPFFTTKGVGKGNGLGLSMVYGFVKQSRGHVTVESAPGEGAIFRIYLPVSSTSAPVVNEVERESGRLPGAWRAHSCRGR